MRVIQINACYSWGSTGTIVTDIQSACKAVGIDCEIAYAMPCHSSVYNGYKISCLLSRKIHALLSKITGKQAYYSSLSTLRLIYHIFKYSPDIVHLHNVHNNYLNLNNPNFKITNTISNKQINNLNINIKTNIKKNKKFFTKNKLFIF